jgi:hypothetical protein
VPWGLYGDGIDGHVQGGGTVGCHGGVDERHGKVST